MLMAIERKFIEDAVIKLSISKFLMTNLTRAGFSRVEIQKTPVLTRITVYVLNPGRVIGRAGKTIDELTETIRRKFAVNNPQISVVEVGNKMLEPLLVAKDITGKLERSINSRKILQQTLRGIMENGALGAEIIMSGKLAAKGARAKTIRKSVGYIPKAGDVTSLVLQGDATAYPKYGAIGVRVRIVPPGTKFPDREIKTIEVPKSILNG
jgi:small subunit ribosomal protein S3